jgi:hypothetical protein
MLARGHSQTNGCQTLNRWLAARSIAASQRKISLPLMPGAVVNLLFALYNHKTLRCLTLEALMAIGKYIQTLKTDIRFVQTADDVRSDRVPPVLPESVKRFLSSAFGMNLADVDDLWEIAKDCLWELPSQPLSNHDYRVFKEHGWPQQLSTLPTGLECSNLYEK